jgi:hypothetical protein
VTDKFLWKLFIIFDFAPDLYLISLLQCNRCTFYLHDHLNYLVLCWVLAQDAEYMAHIATGDMIATLNHKQMLKGQSPGLFYQDQFFIQPYPRILAEVNIYQEWGGRRLIFQPIFFPWSLFYPAALPHNIKRVAIYHAGFTALFCLVSRTLFILGT